MLELWTTHPRSGGTSGGLTAVTVTEGPVSASVGKKYLCMITAALTVNLPENPSNGGIIEIQDVNRNFGTHNVTINAAGTETIQDTDGSSVSSVTMNDNGQKLQLEYVAANNEWIMTRIS